MARGREAEAADAYGRAYAIRPDDPNALANLAIARTVQGDPDEGMRLAQAALDRDDRTEFAVSALLQAAARSDWQGDPATLIPTDLRGSSIAEAALADFMRRRWLPEWENRVLALPDGAGEDNAEIGILKALAVLSVAVDSRLHVVGGSDTVSDDGVAPSGAASILPFDRGQPDDPRRHGLEPDQMGLDVNRLVRGSATEVAADVLRGVGVVVDWPDPLRVEARVRLETMSDDMTAYKALRRQLRWLAGRSAEARSIMESAFPTLDGRKADPFASAMRYYDTTYTNRSLKTMSSNLAKLRGIGAIRYEQLPSKERLRIRYAADDVDTLRAMLADATSPAGAASEIDMPTYAIDLLVACGDLVILDHPGIVALRGIQVSKTTLASLSDRLAAGARTSNAPDGYVTLSAALRRYPSEKPWGAAVGKLLSRDVPFHISSDRISVRSILVDASKFEELAATPLELDRCVITDIPIRDACEILASKYEQAVAAFQSAGLILVRSGKGVGVSRAVLRAFVRQAAFTGEAAAFARWKPVGLHHELKRLAIPCVHGAWSRQALVDIGMAMPSD